MNQLEKALIKVGEKGKEKESVLLDEAKLLLSNNAAEERNFLRSVGLSFNMMVAEERLEQKIRRETTETKFGRPYITKEEAKKFCDDYRLVVDKPHNFIGEIPATLAAELMRFCKDLNIPVPAHSDYTDFRIMAPPHMFSAYQNPAQVLKQAWNEGLNYANEQRELRKNDPLLLLQTEGGYVIIKSWGEDFTPLRKLYALLYSPNLVSFLFSLVPLLILAVGVGLTFLADMVIGAETADRSIGFMFTAVILWVLTGVGIVAWFTTDEFRFFRRYILNRMKTSLSNNLEHWKVWTSFR